MLVDLFSSLQTRVVQPATLHTPLLAAVTFDPGQQEVCVTVFMFCKLYTSFGFCYIVRVIYCETSDIITNCFWLIKH